MKKATVNPKFGSSLNRCGRKHPQIKTPAYNISRQSSTFSFYRTMVPAFRKMSPNISAMAYGNCVPETTVYSISILIMTPLFFSINSAKNGRKHHAAKLTRPNQSVMITYPERRLKKHENLERLQKPCKDS